MIPCRGFEPRKAQAAAPQLAILEMGIPEVATPAEVIRAVVILGVATRAGAVGEVIPQEVSKTRARTLKPIPKCSH